jgi:hypothetical protein
MELDWIDDCWLAGEGEVAAEVLEEWAQEAEEAARQYRERAQKLRTRG